MSRTLILFLPQRRYFRPDPFAVVTPLGSKGTSLTNQSDLKNGPDKRDNARFVVVRCGVVTLIMSLLG